MKIVGINVPFLDGTMRERLTRECEKHGFEARFYTAEALKAQGAQDCEIFFGMISTEMLPECRALKWFHCSFAGVDRYCDDTLYANADLILSNSAGAYGITIAEHLICTLIMIMRRMTRFVDAQKRHEWDRNTGDMRSIYGSTVVVLGMGDIGTNFAERIKPMGARVRGVRRNMNKAAPACFDEVYHVDKLDDALKGADVIALCLPETGETKHIMDERRFLLMNRESYVLNVGRGSAIDQQAIANALKSGHIAGAALDVFSPEPLPENHFLWDTPNLLITPHVSGNMSLSYTREYIMSIFIENLELYAQGKPLKHVVDRKLGY